MERKRRERQMYNYAVIALCIICMIGLTGRLMENMNTMKREQTRTEQHEREYDARMNQIDAGRRQSGEDAMLEKAEQWQQSQKGR